MPTTKLWLEAGLRNWATGVILDCVYANDNDASRDELPCAVVVELQDNRGLFSFAWRTQASMFLSLHTQLNGTRQIVAQK